MIDEKGYVLQRYDGKTFPAAGGMPKLFPSNDAAARGFPAEVSYRHEWSIVPVRITDAPADELREAEHRMLEAQWQYEKHQCQESDARLVRAISGYIGLRRRLESPAQPAEQPAEAPAEQFAAHLDKSSATVAQWPEWKRNVLGRTAAETPPEDLQSRITAAAVAWADAKYEVRNRLPNATADEFNSLFARTETLQDAYFAIRREAEKPPEPTYYIVARDAKGCAVHYLPDRPNMQESIALHVREWLARGLSVKRESVLHGEVRNAK